MKRIIRFSNIFIPAVILSIAVICAGIAGYVYKDGFNLGVDFQAGLLQEVQFAPKAFLITYNGAGNATFSYSRAGISIVVTGGQNESVQNSSFNFDFSAFSTMKSLTDEMMKQVEGLNVELAAPADASSEWLVESAQGTPKLSETPYVLHYLKPDSEPVDIAAVRAALDAGGRTASVQELGISAERRFMIRMQDEESGAQADSDAVSKALEAKFGEGSVSITRSDYVGSRFSKQLQDQAGILMALTMLLILIYASVRFKPQFAVGAVLAIAHDALIMVAFIAWTRMEFNTTTIAAILTILGYSINDTIVVFDRIRETRRLYPDNNYRNVLDRALSETLARTIITTLTTMLAVLALYFWTSDSMKDFALALLVGMVSGVYSTIFVASGWTLFWEKKIKRDKKAVTVNPVTV